MMRRTTGLLAAAVTLLLVGAATAAAGTTVPDVEAWLDRPLPTDLPAGSPAEIGAMLWNRASDTAIAPSVFVRLHPASGDAPPVEVPARQDWPGHFVAQVTLPAGGLGEVEIGTTGSACTAAGCVRSDAIYDIAGVGPPPAAPLTTIATAQIVPPAEGLIAGVPAEVGVRLTPRAAWDSDAVPFPSELLVQARRPREPVLVEATAHLVDSGTGGYRATITMPEAGTFVVQAATTADDSTDGLFGGSAVSLTVEPAQAGEALPDPGPTLPVVLTGIVAASVVVAGVIVALGRRADL